MNNAQSVIVKTTNENYDASKIKLSEKFGEVEDPFTGKKYFRNYVAYPYYSIKEFCSVLDGEIIQINKNKSEKGNTSIIIKTEELEIEYFGWINLNTELNIGDKIKKGTFLGILFGGGESGMKLHIRMKYKNKIINPSIWLESY
ncbi:peptidoglycan DD-metalloendopeptidase family protein [Treponema sp. OMZ 857]|uniref:peptidoglycan DD-metalloendopeptidase family protein n=1 Tax=Treponema sp. OMZ 857 TaxID=1643513 RepID=UPI0020A5D46A|nr:peptidoglycan DD-metalloendopeptidase family protein [Treponema sp. OMZ 857]UTC42707.1 M23 family metallopeptidase [Treponema sp. OMZ 857]